MSRPPSQTDGELSPPYQIREYTRSDWLELARRNKPDWTDEELAQAWGEFCALRAKRSA